MRESYAQALTFRHACKLFNGEKIPKEDLHYILEAGRLAPSSFGMEPWRFIVIQEQKLKERLKPLCWDQNQITSCSDLVVILADTKKVAADSDYVHTKFASRGLDEEATQRYIGVYNNYVNEKAQAEQGLECWTKRQCYIAATSMMMGAASIEIDSCPIEGFELEKVEKLLDIDSSNYRVALILTFGYRVNEAQPKLRNALDDVVEYR